MFIQRLEKWGLASIVLVCLLGIAIYYLFGLDLFDEMQPITFLSTLQLFTIGWVCHQVLKLRSPVGFNLKLPTAIWGLMSFGFYFLGLDELLRIHESLDHNIHDIFGMQETPLTDRIDDLLIALYGIIGIGMLYWFRKEINHFRFILPILSAGFACLFLMVILDAATNRSDLLELVFEKQLAKQLKDDIGVLEDSFKLIAGAFFLRGMAQAYLKAETQTQEPELQPA